MNNIKKEQLDKLLTGIELYFKNNIKRKMNIYDAINKFKSYGGYYFNEDKIRKEFKIKHGMSPKAYMNVLKLKEIEKHCEEKDTCLLFIANQVAYQDESSLNKFIKKMTGMTAKDYLDHIINSKNDL